jgi:tetraacyldisaccharide 4'-kinase
MSQPIATNLERWVLALWYGDSRFSIVLQPLAIVFGWLVALRRWGYRCGILKSVRLGVPVIVIGNITVGGTGKTPLVAWLATQLKAAGARPGIVTRGYGGNVSDQPRLVTRASSVAEVGDEAVLLAIQTDVPICVSRDRVAAAQYLMNTGDTDIIIADDGLQHYRLARDVEIAVLDGDRLLGNGRMLPAGPLRESALRLQEVDQVLVNGQVGIAGSLTFRLMPDRVLSLDSSTETNLAAFRNQRVWAVAGIGNPARFFEMLSAAEIEPVAVDVPDHGTVVLGELRKKNMWPILMTSKDAVKYAADPVSDSWQVTVELEIQADEQALLLQRIDELISREPV